jgi:hypothetical protein
MGTGTASEVAHRSLSPDHYRQIDRVLGENRGRHQPKPSRRSCPTSESTARNKGWAIKNQNRSMSTTDAPFAKAKVCSRSFSPSVRDGFPSSVLRHVPPARVQEAYGRNRSLPLLDRQHGTSLQMSGNAPVRFASAVRGEFNWTGDIHAFANPLVASRECGPDGRHRSRVGAIADFLSLVFAWHQGEHK